MSTQVVNRHPVKHTEIWWAFKFPEFVIRIVLCSSIQNDYKNSNVVSITETKKKTTHRILYGRRQCFGV